MGASIPPKKPDADLYAQPSGYEQVDIKLSELVTIVCCLVQHYDVEIHRNCQQHFILRSDYDQGLYVIHMGPELTRF